MDKKKCISKFEAEAEMDNNLKANINFLYERFKVEWEKNDREVFNNAECQEIKCTPNPVALREDFDRLIDRMSVRDLLWGQFLHKEINDKFFNELRYYFPDIFTSGIERSSRFSGFTPYDLVDFHEMGEVKKRLIKKIKAYIRRSKRKMKTYVYFDFEEMVSVYEKCSKKLTRSNFDTLISRHNKKNKNTIQFLNKYHYCDKENLLKAFTELNNLPQGFELRDYFKFGLRNNPEKSYMPSCT